MSLLAGWVVCFALSAVPVVAQAPDDLATKSQHGKELMAAGKFEEAIPIYRDLVSALPNNPGPVMNLGMALHMAGHDQEAVREFERVLKLQPEHLPAHLFLGAAYLGLKQPAQAVAPLETFVRAHPKDGEAQELLGDALLALGRLQSAAGHYASVTRLEPDKPKGWNGLGLSYEGLADRSFEELEKIAPESAFWLALVAESRAKGEQYNRAFYFYREALNKSPKMHGLHAALAEIYRRTAHADWAAVEEERERGLGPRNCAVEKLACDFHAGLFRQVVESSEKGRNAEAYYWRTRAYNELARQAFARLAQLAPSAEVYELLANVHFRQRKYFEAAKDWQEALKFSPGNPFFLQRLGMSLSANGDFEHALPILSDLAQQPSASGELDYWLGYTLLGLEKPAEAVPYLEKAVARDPTVLQFHRELARAYLRVGEAAKAIPHLKAAMPIDDDGSVYYQMARAYHLTGQKELEREMLAKFKQTQASSAVEERKLEEQMQISAPLPQ